MNARGKEKLRLFKARRKLLKAKQYGVIVQGGGLNVLEFVDEAFLVRVTPSGVMLYKA